MLNLKTLSLILLALLSIRLSGDPDDNQMDFLFWSGLLLVLLPFFIYAYLYLKGWITYLLWYGLPIWWYNLRLSWNISREQWQIRQLQTSIEAMISDLEKNNDLRPKFQDRVIEHIVHRKNQLCMHREFQICYEEERQNMQMRLREMFLMQRCMDQIHLRLPWKIMFLLKKVECDPEKRDVSLQKVTRRVSNFRKKNIEKNRDLLYDNLDVSQRRRRLKRVMNKLILKTQD